MFGQGNLTLLAFVFALRHKVTILNLLFHASSLSSQIQKEEFKNYLNGMDMRLNFKFSNLFEEHEKLLHPDFWGNLNKLPIVGFSAVGCLLVMQDIQLCRAFDHYDITHCKNQQQRIFCPIHAFEKFWGDDFTKEASTQAKMFQFYLDKNNFKEFDEISLQKMLHNFFHKYTDYSNDFFRNITLESPDKIQLLLTFYQFLNLEELKYFGLEELRKRFLEKAKQLHPDVGGSQELFREARKNYELLRNLL